jgi:hypothetical protein
MQVWDQVLVSQLLDTYSCCVSTGDEDLPVRDPLHERRAKYDSVKARHAAADGDAGSKRARNADDADYLVGTLRSLCLLAQHEGSAAVCIIQHFRVSSRCHCSSHGMLPCA